MVQTHFQEKKRFFKSIGIIGLITTISRSLGLIREMVIASFLGTSFYSDAFTLAFTLPNLFRRLTAEGVMANVFIPLFGEIKKKEGEKKALIFAQSFFWILCFFLTVITCIFVIFSPWIVKYVLAVGFTDEPLRLTVFLTRFMFSYIILISLTAICQGILNAFSIFWVSSLTPVLLNISVITFSLILSPRLNNPTYGFAIGVLIGGFIQLFFHVPFLKRLGFRFFIAIRLSDPYLRKAVVLLLPTIFGAGIYQINVIISNLIASTLNEGAISSLKFSNRLLELVLGILVVSITTVVLPRFSHLFLEGRINEVKNNLEETFRLIAFITLPATVGVLVASEDIVTLLFARGEFDNNSVILTSGALRYHIIGLLFISWNRILLTCYQAKKHIKRTVHIAGVVLLVNLIGALWFSQKMDHLGIALASTISQIIQTALLVFFLRELSIERFLTIILNKNILKNIIISLILLASLWHFKQLIYLFNFSNLLNVILLITTGILSMLILSVLFKIQELYEFMTLLFGRKDSRTNDKV